MTLNDRLMGLLRGIEPLSHLCGSGSINLWKDFRLFVLSLKLQEIWLWTCSRMRVGPKDHP